MIDVKLFFKPGSVRINTFSIIREDAKKLIFLVPRPRPRKGYFLKKKTISKYSTDLNLKVVDPV